MEFTVTVDRRGDVVILRPAGWFVYDGVPTFRRKLEEALGEGANRVVVDLEGVSFMDSAGVGALVSTLTTMRKRGGELALINLSPEVRKVLELTRLLKLFDVYDDLKSAVGA